MDRLRPQHSFDSTALDSSDDRRALFSGRRANSVAVTPLFQSSDVNAAIAEIASSSSLGSRELLHRPSITAFTAIPPYRECPRIVLPSVDSGVSDCAQTSRRSNADNMVERNVAYGGEIDDAFRVTNDAYLVLNRIAEEEERSIAGGLTVGDEVKFKLGGSPSLPMRSENCEPECTRGSKGRVSGRRSYSRAFNDGHSSSSFSIAAPLPRRRAHSTAVDHPPSIDVMGGDGGKVRRKNGIILDDDSINDARDRQLLVELDELNQELDGSDRSLHWRQSARFIKYEETVEIGAERLGTPKLPTLSFHGLLELRHCLEKGAVMLDLRASSVHLLFERIVNQMCLSDLVDSQDREHFRTLLSLPHVHVGQQPKEELRRRQTGNSLHHIMRMAVQLPHSPLADLHENENCKSREENGDCTMRNASSSVDSVHYPIANRLTIAPVYHTRIVVEHGDEQCESGETLLPQSAGPISDEDFSPPQSPRLRHKRESEGGNGNWLRAMGDCFKECARREGECCRADYDLLKRLTDGAEGASVCVGSSSRLRHPCIFFVRLKPTMDMDQMLEIDLPIRYIFVVVGPLSPTLNYHEIGRSMCALLTNKRFRDVANAATERTQIIQAINDFLDESLVVPPGDWDKYMLVDMNYDTLRGRTPQIQPHRRPALTGPPEGLATLICVNERKKLDDPLRVTNTLFGGLRREANRRFPYYLSDLSDALNIQCLRCVVFIFLTCFFPALTFGAILSESTAGQIGVTETLLVTSIGGMLFALFSTQPLLVLGVCGPMLIFEESLYMFCAMFSLAFLRVRVWIAIWAMVFAIVTIAFEAPFLIRYVTRFSDDILSALVSIIFIAECGDFIAMMFERHPIMNVDGYCNVTEQTVNETVNAGLKKHNFGFAARSQPHTALLSCILIAATFFMAFGLRQVRNSRYFGRQVRRALGDFGISLSVIVMVLVDRYVIGVSELTTKLRIEPGVVPTQDRQWLVAIAPASGEWWLALLSAIPGSLLFLILFAETLVCEMMLAAPSLRIRKGTGYHWDLLLSGALLVVSSLFGLPWLCAASVQSTAHVHSLTLHRPRAPGQKPRVTGVVEQRLTAFTLNLFIGCTLLFPDVLRAIPVAVLFGVFLYLGLMNMSSSEMLQRMILFFVPVKYHPDATYCRRVKAHRMHLFTAIQLLCFVVVWLIKSNRITAFGFPLAMFGIIIFRHCVVPRIFKTQEVFALDGADDEYEEDKEFENNRVLSSFQVNKIR